MLTKSFEKTFDKETNNIKKRTCCQTLLKQVPSSFDVFASDAESPFMLVKDSYSNYPNYMSSLYMDLDF